MVNKSNKTISVNSEGMIISFTDTKKHQFIKFEKMDDFPKRKKENQELETPVFNQRQQKMYAEALYGLSIYHENDVKKMPKNVVMRIITRCEAVQRTINRWKQEVSNSIVDKFLLDTFPNSPIVKQMVDVKGYDDTINCKLSFKDLGMNQLTIAKKLVDLHLLPQTFFELT